MKRHLAYLRYVLRHKWFVFQAGRKLGVSLWSLICHDWDKFLPDEWFPYARTFYKPDGSHQYVESVEFARAWMLHQHRNKHHWQWWLQIYEGNKSPYLMRDIDMLVWDRGNAQLVVKRNSGASWWLELRDSEPEFYPIAMSVEARREMLADWIGAGRAIGKPDTLAWYTKNCHNMILHPATRRWIEEQLGYEVE